jgi:hypothetical protein
MRLETIWLPRLANMAAMAGALLASSSTYKYAGTAQENTASRL